MRCECGNESMFKEIIDKGIKQEIDYEDGYVIKEVTTYTKDKGVAICGKCGERFNEYTL